MLNLIFLDIIGQYLIVTLCLCVSTRLCYAHNCRVPSDTGGAASQSAQALPANMIQDDISDLAPASYLPTSLPPYLHPATSDHHLHSQSVRGITIN